MSSERRPEWQLPPGVSRSLWEYAHSEPIAQDYDDFFAFNSLFELDEQVLRRHFTAPGLVADLGCGTGRALIPLVRSGFCGLAIDLSEEMLAIVKQKAQEEDLSIEFLCANLVELDPVADDSVDFAMCLFSTLGMIRGRDNRRRALCHARRILKPNGKFVLHVHNFWFNLFDPAGPWWVLKNVLRAAVVGDFERGDKYFEYRGVPNMFLHVFTLGELKQDLRHAGFQIRELILLDTSRQRPLSRPYLFGRIRANGWIVVCE